MAFAPERDGTAPFLDLLAHERQAYALPPRLRELAERVIHRTLELLFPHFAAEVGGRAGEVGEELLALRTLLTDTLRLPGTHCADPEAAVERLVRALPDIRAALPEVREALLEDAHAICASDPAAESMDEVILAYPGFRATAVYRLAHVLHLAGIGLFSRLLTEVAHRETGVDIHPGAKIGRGLAIDHGTGIVIGETAEIGRMVRLYQGVTLGALSVDKHRKGTKRHPTIGDDVIIYANATILGGDTVVGRGSRIGGNVWLTKSVAPLSVVLPTASVARDAGKPSPDDDSLEYHL